MDTSSQVDTTAPTDSQQQPTLRRRYRSVEEKRRIVEKTYVKGWSVARVAREHEVNANQVFSWRRLYEKGRLGGPAMKLLPAAAETTRTRRLRHWSVKAKQQIVNASLVPGARVKDIARAHGVVASLVYDWRKRFAGKGR